MLDVDGTLAPIVEMFDRATVPLETQRAVAALAERPDVHVALVSGRSAAVARRMVGVSNLWVAGNHGFEKRVNSVSGLLRLLDEMPAAEPPADLMVRTLHRIEERRYQAPAAPASAPIHPGVQLEPRRPE